MTDAEIRKLQAQHPVENDPMPFARAVESAIVNATSQPTGQIEPVAWVMPGHECNLKGWIDAKAWPEGEFTVPVYTTPQQPAPGFTGMSAECDFEKDIWSFKMDPGYRVSAGQYLITRIKAAPKATGSFDAL